MNETLNLLRRRYGSHTPALLGARHSYAVLCPLLEQADGLHLLFEVRAQNLRQGGEVCFPGGRMEHGESPLQAALRETEEELAIPPETVEILGTPDFICNQRNFLLRPVVGLVSPAGLAAMTPSAAEVAETFTVPLSFFRATAPEIWHYALEPRVPADFPYEAVGIPEDYHWNWGDVEVPIWHYGGHTIWGMTARLVRELIRE